MQKPPSSGKVRLQDVASAAGVSSITVSRAFTAPEQLHPKTLQHVLDTASALGYIARSASAQKPRRRHVIGVVNPQMNNPFFSELTATISQMAETRAIDVLMMNSCDTPALEEAAIDRLIACGVDGIILTVISSDARYRPRYFQRLAAANIAVVLVDREVEEPHYAGVYIDNLDCGYQAGKWMRQQPVRRLLVLAGPADSLVTIGRMSGIREALGDSDIELEVHYGDFSATPAEQFLTTRLETSPRPDALIGINNQITLGILGAYRRAGLPLPATPNGPPLFCIDGIAHAETLGLAIPCIRHDLSAIATQSVDLLLDALGEQRGQGTRQIVRGYLHLPSAPAPGIRAGIRKRLPAKHLSDSVRGAVKHFPEKNHRRSPPSTPAARHA